MAHKPKTIYEITSKFAIKTILLIKLEPDYESINEMMQLIYANVATLPTPQVGLQHENIVSILNPTLYTTLTKMAWIDASNPGVYPMMPTNSTAALRKQLQVHHEKRHII